MVNGSNYLFHVIAGRILGPESYGALSALLAFFVWAAICATATQLVISGKVSSCASPADWPFVRILKACSFVGVVTGFAALLASPLIRDFLQLRSLLGVVLLAAYPLSALLGAVGRGVIQGRRKFGLLAAVTAGTSILRLALAVPLLALGGGIESALAATLGAEIVGAIASILPHWSMDEIESFVPLDLLRPTLAAVAAIGGFWAIVSLDTALARHYLDPRSAGFYAAAAVTARGLLFLPGAVAIVMFPRFVALQERREAARNLRHRALVAVGSISLAGAFLLILFREPAIGLLFGPAFTPASDVVFLLGATMVVLALGHLALHYNLALGLRTWPAVASGLALEAVAISLFHENGAQVAASLLATATLFLIAVLSLGRHARRSTGHRSVAVPTATPASQKGVP